MRGKMLFFTIGLVAGACLYKSSPKAQMIVEEATNRVKQKLNEKNQCAPIFEQQQEMPMA